MKNEKNVYLITGAIGAGKTTFSRELLSLLPGIEYMGADYYFYYYFKHNGKKEEPLCYEDAKKYCHYKILKALNNGKSFVLEKTISCEEDLCVLDMFVEYGYCINTYFVGCSNEELLISRSNKRYIDGWYDVPKEKVVRYLELCHKYLYRIREKSNNFYAYDTTEKRKIVFAEEMNSVLLCDRECVWLGMLHNYEIIPKAISVMNKTCVSNDDKMNKCYVDTGDRFKDYSITENMMFLKEHIICDESDGRMVHEIMEDNIKSGII